MDNLQTRPDTAATEDNVPNGASVRLKPWPSAASSAEPPVKILVADDEPDFEILIKQKFRRPIREQRYEFLFAADGSQALERISAHPDIDILLSDLNMPKMDGLSLLHEVSQTYPLVKAVVVSAYGDMANIRSAMNYGAFDFVCKPVNFQDLEVTIAKAERQVQQAKQTLQAIKENNILRMYVDDNVLKFMNSPAFEASLLTNETVEASVVFIDLCQFTHLSESVAADTVVNLLNTYFDVMVKEILAQQGHVDKFVGDAVMAVFRGKYHLDRAVEAALAVRQKIEALPQPLADRQFVPRVSIGINSGDVISGNIGSVSLRRLDFTVIGDVVNTAQRLQAAAGAGKIYLNEACYEKIREFFSCQKVGELALKNKARPVMVYEVIN